MKEKDYKKQQKENFLRRILEAAKIMAEKSKDPKVNKAIKKRANY